MYSRLDDMMGHPHPPSRQRHSCPPRVVAAMVEWLQALSGNHLQLKADALSKPTSLLGAAHIIEDGTGDRPVFLPVCNNSEGPSSSEFLLGSAEDSAVIASQFIFAFCPVLLLSFPYKRQPPTCKSNLGHTLRIYSMSVCFLQ